MKVANPLSLKDIRELVRVFKQMMGLPDDGYVDIVGLLEWGLSTMGVDFQIVGKDEMKENHGETFPSLGIIRIREDVYERACNGYGRDRLTIAHEIAHLFIHQQENVAFAKADPRMRLPAYRDPEWQADAFAGELLAPARYLQGLSLFEIERKYGVSEKAARVQMGRS